jgi:hypothetical protein
MVAPVLSGGSVLEDLVCGNGQEVREIVCERYPGEESPCFLESSAVIHLIPELGS